MILDEWQSYSTENATAVILPDGCRDLICKISKDGRPNWFVSPLYDSATKIVIEAATSMIGFRLKPGVIIDERRLLSILRSNEPPNVDVKQLLSDTTQNSSFVDDALQVLAELGVTVRSASRRLCVTERTLQRRVLRATGRSPSYWLQLARARHTARCLMSKRNISNIAFENGYADQSHMTREFQRWFGTTPRRLLKDEAMSRTVCETGYDGGETGEQISTKNPSGSLT